MNLKISSLLTSASGIVRLIAGMLSAPLLVRSLGLADYGLWSVANSLVLIFLVVDFGVNMAVVTFFAGEVARKDTPAAGRTLATSLLIVTLGGVVAAVCLVIAAPWYGHLLFPDASERARVLPVLALAGASLPLRLWQTWAAAVEGALLRYDWQTAVDLPSSLVIQVGSLAVAGLGGGIVGLALLQIGVLLVTCLAHVWVLKAVLPVPLSIRACSLQSARKLLGFGSIHWLTSVAHALYNQADRVIVNVVLGAHAAGVYSALTAVANKIVEMTVLPLRVLPAAVSSADAVHDRSRVRGLFLEAIRVNGTVMWVCVVGLFFFAEPLMRLVLGAHYVDLAPAGLRGVALISGFQSLCIGAGWFALGLNRPSILMRWGLPAAGLMLLLMFLMSRAFGIMGAVWSNAGYLLTLGVVVQVIRLIEIPLLNAAAGYLPTVAALVGAFALTSSASYATLPLWAQVALFLFVAPAALLSIVSIVRLRDLIPEVTRQVRLLRVLERPLVRFLETLEVQRQGVRNLFEILREDWIAHGHDVMLPGFHMMVCHRYGAWAQSLPALVRPLLIVPYEIGFVFLRNVYKINLYRTTVVGRRVTLSNQGNISIHRQAVLGDDCVIRQNVSIGGLSELKNEGPVLENDVEVEGGAVILGRITIGRNAKISPNAVVTQDVPPRAIVIAPSTRILKLRSGDAAG